MIEELAEGGGGARPARLLAVDGVEGLVHEGAEDAEEDYPLGD